MSTIDTTKHYTEAQLDELVQRGIAFLRALSTKPALWLVMTAHGYDADIHKAGWDQVLGLSGYGNPPILPKTTPAQLQAAARLDDEDGPLIRMIRATCSHLYPEQGDYLLAGLSPARGYAAVANIQVIADRYAALRDGKDDSRPASARDKDAACVAELARRNILTPAIEAQHRALIAEATAQADLVPDRAELERWEAARQQSAQRLDIWLRDWRDMARAIFSRREDLLALGLLKRHRPASDEVDLSDDGTDAENDVETPAPTPPA